MKLRVAFLVNGLGLGNAARCHAIIERLPDAEIGVITSGVGLWYFRNRTSLTHLIESPVLAYGSRGGRLDIGRTLASAGALAATVRTSARLTAALLDDWRPDVVVTDSFYGVWPVLRRRLPFVAINNAGVVTQAYHHYRDRPPGIRAQFWTIEWPDALFHRWVPWLTLSPALQPARWRAGSNVRAVAPIVRLGYTPSPHEGTVQRVVVMLSGSALATPVEIRDRTIPYRIDVMGRPAPAHASPENVVHHGRVADNRDLLLAADLVVINAGFSAVSEVFAMRKPMVVLPIAGHAEQWCNARQVEELGIALVASEETLEDTIREAVSRIGGLRAAYASLPVPGDGAAEAAAAIRDIAAARSR